MRIRVKMNIDKLSKILDNVISSAPDKKKLMTLILFGIKYAEYLEKENFQIQKILTQSAENNKEISIAHDVQIRHGVDLAEFVRLK